MVSSCEQTKQCTRCKEEKQFDLFGRRNGNNLRSYCKPCEIEDKRLRTKKYSESRIIVTSKVCSKCRIDLPISNFTKRSAEKDGYDYKCKKCYRDQRVEKLREQGRIINAQNCSICGKLRPNMENNTRLYEKCVYKCDDCRQQSERNNCAVNKEYIANMKVKLGKCMNCGEQNTSLLKFVLSGKYENYFDTGIYNWRLKKIQAEIEKAQLLCKCCRILKKVKPSKTFKTITWRKDRNDAYINERKVEAGSCVRCSRKVDQESVRCFHFHYRTNGKKCLHAWNTSASVSLETVQKSIDECELICANCHLGSRVRAI
jgi:hypothetical protein